VRSLSLARIAAQAEKLHLRHMLRRQATRAAFAAVAVVFLLAALALVHVAGVAALADRVTPIQALLIVAGIDVVLAVVLGLLAARDVPGRVEREALQVRVQAIEEAVETVVVVSLLRRLLGARSIREMVEVATATGVTWYMGKRR
jgi:arginine exporter protein ArgO